MMTILVVGASGATGRLLVEQLLASGEKVKVIVRSLDRFPAALAAHDQLDITEGDVLSMTDEELVAQVSGCSAVASCLGHNLSVKGVFGHPRRLVTQSIQRVCEAIEKTTPAVPVKIILMNTTGNQNSLAGETVSMAQAIIIGLLRVLLPPHADNEEAAAYLQSRFSGEQSKIEWVAVRPDGLIDHQYVTEYDIHASPIRSAIFDAGKTSRINVAHFMAQLAVDERVWLQWKGEMPVIYNH